MSNVIGMLFKTLGTINAHDEEISCLAINQLGSLIASTSSKRTSIRIWNTFFKTMVTEIKLEPNTGTLYWYVIYNLYFF